MPVSDFWFWVLTAYIPVSVILEMRQLLALNIHQAIYRKLVSVESTERRHGLPALQDLNLMLTG